MPSARCQSTAAQGQGACTPSLRASNDARWGCHPGPARIDPGGAPVLRPPSRVRITLRSQCARPSAGLCSGRNLPPLCCALPRDLIIIAPMPAEVLSRKHDPVGRHAFRVAQRDFYPAETLRGSVCAKLTLFGNCRRSDEGGGGRRGIAECTPCKVWAAAHLHSRC